MSFLAGYPWPLDGVSRHEPTPEEVARSPFGGAVQELAEGRAHRFRRGDLPDGHSLNTRRAHRPGTYPETVERIVKGCLTACIRCGSA